MKFLCSFLLLCSLYTKAQLSKDSIIGSWEVNEAIFEKPAEKLTIDNKVDDRFLKMVFTFEKNGILKVTSPRKENKEVSEYLSAMNGKQWFIDNKTQKIRVGSPKDHFTMAQFSIKKSVNKMDMIFIAEPPRFILKTIKLNGTSNN